MAETDNNAPGGVNDPVKMRNTETAALKRVPVSPNAASASSAARKTIKLKPLVPSGTGASSAAPASAPASAPRSVPPPSILMNHKPAAPKTEEPPKFMSTNTAPIGKISKPNPEKPIPAADLGDAPTKTVSIPRLQAKMTAKPAVTAPAAPAAAPTTATVSVPKITPAAPKPAPPAAPTTATVSVPKITPSAPKPAPAPATVGVPKITPFKKPESAAPAAAPATATVGVPKIRPAAPAAQPAPTDPKSATVALTPGDAVTTTTQGMEKQAIDQAKQQSGLQGAKPAIKLRPSNSPTQQPEALSPVSPTIKLTPKADSTVSPMPPPAEPEAENADSSKVTVTTKIPRKTLQLKPKMPSAPTEAKLKEQGDIANQNIKSGVEAGDQTIQQTDSAQDDKPLVDTDKDKKGKNAEPNIIFSISAILAFLIIGYTVFALTAQFLNMWEGKQLPVAGFQQIFNSSKK